MSAKVATPDKSLDQLHAERTALVAKKAEIAKLRDKLSGCDEELEAASKAATKFSEHEADLVDKWMDGGACGPKPTADFRQMQKLEARRLAAAAACDHARNAKESLDAREAALNRELATLHGEIEGEVSRPMGRDFGELGAKAARLRRDLDGIGAELLAARHLFKGMAEKSFDDTGRREPSFDFASRAATHGLAHIPSIDASQFSANRFPLADRELVRKIEARFHALCEGELK